MSFISAEKHSLSMSIESEANEVEHQEVVSDLFRSRGHSSSAACFSRPSG